MRRFRWSSFVGVLLVLLPVFVTGTVADVEEAVAAVEAEMARMSHYDVLGVSNAATLPEIKKAFRAKSLELHPDKLTHESEENRAIAQARFLRVVEAFETLKDERKRAWYDLTQRASSFTFSAHRGNRSEDGKIEFSLALKLQFWAFLFVLALFVTWGFYLNIVIVYMIYSVLFRFKYLWKYAVFVIFALLVNNTTFVFNY